MKAAAAGVLVTSSGLAFAQQACLEITDSEKRLACYDKALNFKMPDTPAPVQPKPQPSVKFSVRDKGELNNFAGADLGAQAGQFAIQRIDGKDYSSVKLGVIAAFRPINALGWQPFASLGWNRDLAAKTPRDLKDLSIGLTGPLWDPFDTGWTLYPTLRVTRRVDSIGNADANRAAVHVNFVRLAWVNSVPGRDSNSYQFVPHFGLAAENRLGNGADQGYWRSGYVGATLTGQLNGVMPRLSGQATYRLFNDEAAPATNPRRHGSYGSLTLSYDLTDPEDKSIVVRPSLALTRETGTDFLYGGTTLNRTVFGFNLKVN